jgi:hypothetical protein
MADQVTPVCLAKMARSFVAIGGRLMIDPQGRYITGIDMARLFERTSPNPEDSTPFAYRRMVARRFTNAEQGQKAALTALIRKRGKSTPHGWIVWGAC